jgi:dTDP-4-amino-4,6-dideoxygalactose transaminase
MMRRAFLKTSSAITAASLTIRTAHAEEDLPAILGGAALRKEPFPGWPIVDQREDHALLEVLHSGLWFRGNGTKTATFESRFAEMMGAKHCVATANGTSALFASLAAIGVEPGDEVIVPPYTFIATVNAVLLQYALPIFVDVDRETFQIDTRKLEAAITDRTVAIMPVHLGGNVSDMEAIQAIAARHKLKVIEDACQAHLAEWKGKKVGTIGSTGCFSFQVTKNLASGEGGAILTNDDDLIERCYAFHNNCRSRGTAGYNFTYLGSRGANLRMTEFQGALLLAQMTRLEQQAKTRSANAAYLTTILKEIPGIHPAREYEGCTRNAYHLYMFRYDPSEFHGMTRARFIDSLTAEGIPCSSGYAPLQREGFLREAIASRGFERIFPREVLAGWEDRARCPENDKLCEEAVWFTQTMFLGTRSDMDQIAAAIRKIRNHAARIAS